MENGKKINPALKIIFIVIGIIALLIVVFIAWFMFPIKSIPSERFLPAEATAHFSFTIDSKNPGIAFLMGKGIDFIRAKIPAAKKIPFLKQAIDLFLPRQVTGVVTLDENTKNPGMEAIISMKNSIKFISLMEGVVDKAFFSNNRFIKNKEQDNSYKALKETSDEFTLAAYSIIGNNFLASTTPAILKNSLKNYSAGAVQNSYIKTMAGRLNQSYAQTDGFIYMDNSRGGLSRLIAILEEKVAFAAFPTIDSIAYIQGNIELTEKELKGMLIFHCPDKEKLPAVQSDVNFLYGAVRRVVRPYDMDLKGTISIGGDGVSLDFIIQDFTEILFNYLTNKQGGGEDEN